MKKKKKRLLDGPKMTDPGTNSNPLEKLVEVAYLLKLQYSKNGTQDEHRTSFGFCFVYLFTCLLFPFFLSFFSSSVFDYFHIFT